MNAPIRRRLLGALAIAAAGGALTGCAGLGGAEPLNVNLAGLEPLEGAAMEARFLARLRVQNPNDQPLAFDGVAVEVDLNGRELASGVSDATGTVPRFGEALVEVPVTVPATAIVWQIIGFMGGDQAKATYRVRGFLHTGTFGRVRFDSSGEIELPRGPGG
jgi:LEA14-like dessication related protein